MTQILLIAAGGGIGSVMRFWIASNIYNFLGRSFPYGTLTVNIIGSLLMGFLSILLLQHLNNYSSELRSFLLIGFLGGFTTFSAFSMETLTLIESGDYTRGFLNIFLSLTLCLGAVWLGVLLGKQL